MKKDALVYAKTKHVRTSVKRARPVASLVRNKSVSDARNILSFNRTKAAKLILKTLNSAVANARHNLNLNEKDLYVSEVFVNEGSTMKRGMIIARSRFNPFLKRSAHIVVGLSERKGK